MKFTFNFTETNYGSVSVNADSEPNRADVINAIHNGNAFYKDTDYFDIKLIETSNEQEDE